MNDDLWRWHALSWLVGLISMTGRLPERKPQSLLILAEPGTGKTALLERFRDEANNHMLFASNASAWGLQSVLRDDVPRGITHFIVPEFQSLMLRKGAVWETLLGLLLPAMDEGVGDIFVGPRRTSFNGARLGIVAAMPLEAYHAHYAELRATGLLSRFLVVRYERDSRAVVASRHRWESGNHAELTPIACPVPPIINIEMPRAIAHAIIDYAANVNSHDANRTASRFHALVRVIAFACGATVVDLEHLFALVDLQTFWQ